MKSLKSDYLKNKESKSKKKIFIYIVLLLIVVAAWFLPACATMGVYAESSGIETTIFCPYIPGSEERAEERLNKRFDERYEDKNLETHFNPELLDTKTSMKYKTKKYEVKEEIIREVTAYNVGDVNQCDDDPCISANGENICEAVRLGYKRCAANFVPFGTHLLVDNYGICLVTDRMNSRYKNRVDIAMSLEEKQRAKDFGLQNLSVQILK